MTMNTLNILFQLWNMMSHADGNILFSRGREDDQKIFILPQVVFCQAQSDGTETRSKDLKVPNRTQNSCVEDYILCTCSIQCSIDQR